MGYKIVSFQNCSSWSGEVPTIVICENDDGWDEAYKNWLDGKWPTNSNEWKKGLYAITKEINTKV